MPRKLSQEIIERIRREVLSGKSNYQVARELGISETTVRNHTKDIARPRIEGPYIRGKQLELLRQLLRDGYVYTSNNRNILRGLQKHFPMIRRAQFKNRSIYYLEDKKYLALQEMIKQNKSRVINYHDLSKLSKVFNITLSQDKKKEILNKSEDDDSLAYFCIRMHWMSSSSEGTLR